MIANRNLEPRRKNDNYGNATRRQKPKLSGCIGVQYTLSTLIIAGFCSDTDGDLRLQIHTLDIPLAKRQRPGLMCHSDVEYMAGLKYVLTNLLHCRFNYDNDVGVGAGATLKR